MAAGRASAARTGAPPRGADDWAVGPEVVVVDAVVVETSGLGYMNATPDPEDVPFPDETRRRGEMRAGGESGGESGGCAGGPAGPVGVETEAARGAAAEQVGGGRAREARAVGVGAHAYIPRTRARATPLTDRRTTRSSALTSMGERRRSCGRMGTCTSRPSIASIERGGRSWSQGSNGNVRIAPAIDFPPTRPWNESYRRASVNIP